MHGSLIDLSTFVLIAAGVTIACVAIILLAYIVRRILRNPFHYPYFTQVFDVSRKRNVDIVDYIDGFLCDQHNWNQIVQHRQFIIRWKSDTEAYLQNCRMQKRRTKQYHEILDDQHAFRFETVRNQTRYRQNNYVKTSYKVSVSDTVLAVNWPWLANRYVQLEDIGFEATLKDYHSKSQRKLMTPALRKQIKERDNFTCQMCGKYMPDEVGLHIDHIIPIAKGGKSIPSNLQVLCSKCNGRKSSKI